MKTLADYEKEWKAEAEELVLYHFAGSVGSMVNILKSKTFFATHTSFENDKKEVAAALDVLRDVLDERVQVETEEEKKKLLRETLKRIEKYIKRLSPCEIIKMMNEKKYEQEFGAEEDSGYISKYMNCIICWSVKKDEKWQWEEYGNQRKGCRIALSAKNLTETFRLEGNEAHLYKCIYDKNEQKNFINAIIEETFKMVSQRPEYFAVELFTLFCQYACAIKEWKNEDEWRLVYRNIPIEKMLLRERGNGENVAYTEIPVVNLKNCYKDIVLGFNADDKVAQEQLKQALMENGIVEDKFEKSKIII